MPPKAEHDAVTDVKPPVMTPAQGRLVKDLMEILGPTSAQNEAYYMLQQSGWDVHEAANKVLDCACPPSPFLLGAPAEAAPFVRSSV